MPGREGTIGGRTSSTCATLGSLWGCHCDLYAYGRPPEPAKVAPGEAHTRAAPVETCQKWRIFGRRPRAPPAHCLAPPMLQLPAVGQGSSKGGLHRHLDPPIWSLGGRYSARRHAGAERYLALLRVHRIGARACVIALVPSRATPRRSRPSAVPMSFSCSGGE